MDRYFQVPNEILDAPLNIHQKMVLVYLYRAGNNGAPIYPSYSTIAEKCSMSKSKAISVVNELGVWAFLLWNGSVRKSASITQICIMSKEMLY